MPDITLFPGDRFVGRLITGPPSDPIRVSNQQASLVTADNRGYLLPMSRVRASNIQASLVTVDGEGYQVVIPESNVRVSNVQASLVTIDGVGYEIVMPPFAESRMTQMRVVAVEEVQYIYGPLQQAPPPV